MSFEMICETLVLEVGAKTQDKFFVVIVHRPPSASIHKFLELIENDYVGLCSFMGD